MGLFVSSVTILCSCLRSVRHQISALDSNARSSRPSLESLQDILDGLFQRKLRNLREVIHEVFPSFHKVCPVTWHEERSLHACECRTQIASICFQSGLGVLDDGFSVDNGGVLLRSLLTFKFLNDLPLAHFKRADENCSVFCFLRVLECLHDSLRRKWQGRPRERVGIVCCSICHRLGRDVDAGKVHAGSKCPAHENKHH